MSKCEKYGIVSGYHSKFIKEFEIRNGAVNPILYCNNIEEMPNFTKKEAIDLCNMLNSNDYFAQQSGENMYDVYKLTEITK